MHGFPASGGLLRLGSTMSPRTVPLTKCSRARSRAAGAPHRSHVHVVAATELKSKSWFMPKAKEAAPLADTWVTVAARESLVGVSPEQLEPVEAKLTGAIPGWLRGSLITNGGGDYALMRHMFDGYSVLSKMEIKDGKVFGTQRYMRTKSYSSFKQTGKVCKMEFSTTPTWESPQEQAQYVLGNLVQVASNSIDLTDNASVTLSPMPDGTLLALSEVKCAGYKINPETLETLEQVVLFDDGKPDTIRTAHLKQLPDGSYVGFAQTMPLGKHCVYKMDPKTLKREILAIIPCRETTPGWMHDFAVSDKYAILLEPPLFFSFPAMFAGVLSSEVAGVMSWRPQVGTKVYVVPLDGSGKVRTYNAPAFFYFHFANAFEREDGEYLYVDFNCQEDATRVNELFKEPLMRFPGEDASKAHLRRLSIPLKATPSGNALEDLLIGPQPVVDDEESYGNHAEFMAINPKMQGKRYRYAFACCMKRPSNILNALTKLDLQERRTEAVWHIPGCATGEPVFIPSPEATSEDDGVVIAPVVLGNGHSALVVLDGRSFDQLAIAELPYGTGFRFHGAWLPARS